MMRSRPVALLLPLLGACAAQTASQSTPQSDLPARQEAACRTVIAAHVGRPPAEVTPRWLSETGGIASVEARDGDRLHLCQVDAAGNVLGYSHPGV